MSFNFGNSTARIGKKSFNKSIEMIEPGSNDCSEIALLLILNDWEQIRTMRASKQTCSNTTEFHIWKDYILHAAAMEHTPPDILLDPLQVQHSPNIRKRESVFGTRTPVELSLRAPPDESWLNLISPTTDLLKVIEAGSDLSNQRFLVSLYNSQDTNQHTLQTLQKDTDVLLDSAFLDQYHPMHLASKLQFEDVDTFSYLCNFWRDQLATRDTYGWAAGAACVVNPGILRYAEEYLIIFRNSFAGGLEQWGLVLSSIARRFKFLCKIKLSRRFPLCLVSLLIVVYVIFCRETEDPKSLLCSILSKFCYIALLCFLVSPSLILGKMIWFQKCQNETTNTHMFDYLFTTQTLDRDDRDLESNSIIMQREDEYYDSPDDDDTFYFRAPTIQQDDDDDDLSDDLFYFGRIAPDHDDDDDDDDDDNDNDDDDDDDSNESFE